MGNDSKKIKVLIIAGTMNVGGIENQLMYLIRRADREKFQIDYTTTKDHPYYEEEILSLGGRCIRIPSTEGRRFFRYCRAIYRVMKDGQYDVVHSHELFHSGMVLLIARLAGVKHRFVHAHNWSDGTTLAERIPLKRRVYTKVMRFLIRRNATCFLACSTLAGEYLYGKRYTQRDDYHLIYNSVDTSKFLDRYEREEAGEFTGDGWINVLQIGRFTVVKNQLFSAQIAEELKRRGRRIRILSVGNDGNAYEARVRETIREKGLEEYMPLLGIRKDIDVLMRKSSAFLLPSQYEGMPLVLIEAQSAGLPCVVADTFSHEVDFGLGQIRWLPISEPAPYWADQLEAAVKEPRKAKADVAAVVDEKGFDSNVFARKLCALYTESMGS